MNNDKHLTYIMQKLIGRKIKDVLPIKLDADAENTWSHYDHNEIASFRIWFEDGSILTISQVLEPVDDEETHPENPLNFDWLEH